MEPIFRLPPFEVQAVTKALSETLDWSIGFLGIPTLWAQTEGEGVKVAVLDTGCDLDHPDLQGAVVGAMDFSGSLWGPRDRSSHGCILPTDQIYTSLCGLQEIQVAFDRSPGPVLFTEDGWSTKDVSRLGINTLSLDKSGNTVRTAIKSIHRLSHKGKLFKVKTRSCGVSLTPWHPVYIETSRRGDDRTIVKRRADELRVGDMICASSPSNGVTDSLFSLTIDHEWTCRHCGRTASSGERLQCRGCNKNNWHDGPKAVSIEVGEDFAYLAGLIISDGHLSAKPHQYAVLFFNNDETLIGEFLACCERLGFPKGKRYSDRECCRVEINCKRLWTALSQFGIPVGAKSRTVEIPELLCKSPVAIIRAFVAGVIDGDGCVSGNHVRVATGSRRFADQLCLLSKTLGSRASVSVVKPSPTGVAKTENESFIVALSRDWQGRRKRTGPTSMSRKAERIVSIDIVDYDGPLYDLTIQGEATNYVANGLIVSNTWCAGMIGARANDVGVRGIVPKCQLLIGKVLGDDGSGTEQAILNGIKWADAQGANIISMSLGGPRMSESLHAAIKAFVAKPHRFVICAAGNDGRENSVGYPAVWEETVAVAAVDRTGRLTSFSSRGPEVDIAAPGADMLSTVPLSAGGYAKMSGTSMATPVVAGIAAACLSKHLKEGGLTGLETYQDLLAHLRKTAKDAGPTGPDTGYGWGIIDPNKLLADIAPVTPPVTPTPEGPDVQVTAKDAKGQVWVSTKIDWKKAS